MRAPKPPHNAPDEIVNYDQRIPAEGGAFLAWGPLTYTKPLTERRRLIMSCALPPAIPRYGKRGAADPSPYPSR